MSVAKEMIALRYLGTTGELGKSFVNQLPDFFTWPVRLQGADNLAISLGHDRPDFIPGHPMRHNKDVVAVEALGDLDRGSHLFGSRHRLACPSLAARTDIGAERAPSSVRYQMRLHIVASRPIQIRRAQAVGYRDLPSINSARPQDAAHGSVALNGARPWPENSARHRPAA